MATNVARSSSAARVFATRSSRSRSPSGCASSTAIPLSHRSLDRNRLGQRLDVVAFEMRADHDELHLICFGCEVRMMASTFASTTLRPR